MGSSRGSSFKSYATYTFVAFLALVTYRCYDYNMWLQAPYWAAWTVCHFAGRTNLEYCNGGGLHALAEWAWERTDWSLEQEKPYGFEPIPEIAAGNFSYELLSEMTQGFTRPVVARGLLAETQAIKKWNMQYLNESFGEDIYLVQGRGGVSDQKENIRGAREAKEDQPHVLFQMKKMRLRTIFQRMLGGEKLYLNNVDSLFRKHPHLLDELALGEWIKPWAYDPYEPYAVQLFMGMGSGDKTATTGTLMHAAISTNLFCQIAGVKEWTFISPRYSAFIAPKLGWGRAAATPTENPHDRLPKRWVHLYPGDVLLNPAWQWHEIYNQEGFNMGTATRENHPSWVLRNEFLFSSISEATSRRGFVEKVFSHLPFMARKLAQVPGFIFCTTAIKEWIFGPQPSGMLTAAWNPPCDEHSPEDCSSTVLDRILYGDDNDKIPFVDE